MQTSYPTEVFYTTQHALGSAIRILLSAFVHLSDNWTNKGFKIHTRDSVKPKTCILGAIDVATMEHLNRHVRDDDLAVIIINSVAFDRFQVSAVSVNDDQGYRPVVKLFALAIERAFSDAARIGTGIGRVEYRSARV